MRPPPPFPCVLLGLTAAAAGSVREIGPGCTELTRILRGARSIAAALVIPP